jgi:hypothetical protein
MYKEIIIIFLAALLCIIGFDSIYMTKKNRQNQKDLIEALSENDNLKKRIDDKNREITEVKAVVLSQNREIQKSIKEIDRLKTLDAKIVFKTRTKFDTISVVLRDTTIINTTDTIKVQRFDYLDEWLSMTGVVDNESILFDSLSINNKYSIEIGNVRKGLFKKEKVAFITNENPYSQTQQAQTFVLQEEKKWYQKGIVYVGAAAIGTFFIALGL